MGVATYPGVFAVETTADLAKKTAESLVPQIIKLLTEPVVTAEAAKAALQRNNIVFEGSVDEVSENARITENGAPLLRLEGIDTYYGPIHILQGLNLHVGVG